MSYPKTRRAFLKDLGLCASVAPFVGNLPSLSLRGGTARKQRLVILFSPDGVIPENFWPAATGSSFELPESLKPLEPFKDKTLVLKGLSDKVRGDGDNHMRGIGCLLTGIELYPGNVQGGGDTPAGWSKGHSIDQEIRTFLQSRAATQTRFGSLEFGVMVPDHADTWTRMVYSGPNQPIAPIDDPYQMFGKLYGQAKDQELLRSVLDDLREDLAKVRAQVSADDRKILDHHTTLVREMEQDIRTARTHDVGHAVPVVEPGVRRENDNIPKIAKLQIDLLVSSFLGDFARVATFQFTNSVGEARFTWLGIPEGQHSLSHEPDSNAVAKDKLTRINQWYCSQLAYLAKRLAETPEPDGRGSLLDNTLLVWTNELGKGNTHTLDDIPFVLVGGGAGFRMGRSLDLKHVAHNRFLMSLSHAFGHRIDHFGNPDYCAAGPLSLT